MASSFKNKPSMDPPPYDSLTFDTPASLSHSSNNRSITSPQFHNNPSVATSYSFNPNFITTHSFGTSPVAFNATNTHSQFIGTTPTAPLFIGATTTSPPLVDTPGQRMVTATNTVTTTVTYPENSLALNKEFFKTPLGIIKSLELVVCVLALICNYSSGYFIPFATFVCIGCLMYSIVFLVAYSSNGAYYYTFINWILVELVTSCIWCILSCMAGIVAAYYTFKFLEAAVAMTSFLMFVATAIFGYGFYILYGLHRKGYRTAHISYQVNVNSNVSVL